MKPAPETQSGTDIVDKLIEQVLGGPNRYSLESANIAGKLRALFADTVVLYGDNPSLKDCIYVSKNAESYDTHTCIAFNFKPINGQMTFDKALENLQHAVSACNDAKGTYLLEAAQELIAAATDKPIEPPAPTKAEVIEQLREWAGSDTFQDEELIAWANRLERHKGELK